VILNKLRRAGFVLLALLLFIISSSPVAAQGTVTINMVERGNQWIYEPNTLTVPAGQVRITFRNSGERLHNFVVRQPSGVQRTPDIAGGRTLEQTFNFPAAGTFDVICDLPTHEQRGMKMSITVTGSAPAGSTGGTTGATTGGSAQTGGAAQTGGPSVGATTSPAGTPYLASLLIHIPAAIAWLGIVLYDAIVAAVPFLTPGQRGALLARPRWLVLVTIPLFGLTGIYQTIFNPFSTITSYADLSNLRETTTYGFALFLKHGFVFASMVLTLAVTFYFAPRLLAFADDTRDSAVTPSSMPSLLSWLNVASCVALLACVAVMVFQLH
jgi:plastocyanin